MTRLSIVNDRGASTPTAASMPALEPRRASNPLAVVALGWLSILALGAAAKALGLGWGFTALAAVPGGAPLTLAILAIVFRLEDALRARCVDASRPMGATDPIV